MEAKASRATGHDCYFAIEREDALEIIKLDVRFG